ncbi:signal peptidase II [Alkalibacillus haloalkaliphilus]|uniref:Lipoprotein signal peptidase n=1 Tax=Alkalibacillus haloalkaliphilus TaxID=94136 RepID=A0A511W3A7_9BACI|nr:signal peptidase II [Alkalibacillus haloalkaliphilus]GEN44838.1 lipoprotein signal peptidase [Alkalibacillus haloalkaliphilus]
MIYYIIALLIVALDQITKWMIIQTMNVHESIEVISGFFYITSHRNSGAAWGMLQGQMWLFYIVTVFVVGVIVYYMRQYRNGYKLLNTGFALILGGAIGNFIDRVVMQEVVDFLDFTIFNYNFPIFNVADIALTIGVTIIIILILFDEWNNKRMKNDDE